MARGATVRKKKHRRAKAPPPRKPTPPRNRPEPQHDAPSRPKRDKAKPSHLSEGVRRMVGILEAEGPMDPIELRARMEDTGGNQYFGDIYPKAITEGLAYEDDYGVFHVPAKGPAASPEALATHELYLRAKSLGIIEESGGKKRVVTSGECPLDAEELERVKKWIEEGNAIAASPEVGRINGLYLEGKATREELDECLDEAAKGASSA